MAERDAAAPVRVPIPVPRPGVLDALGQPFRAPAWQRWLGRCLLRLLGIPGVARGLVKLHARRTRQRS